MITVENKVALITGSGRGIGKAIAKELASAGAFVIINGRNKYQLESTEKEIRDSGGQVHAIRADITNHQEASNLISSVIEKYGKLDILVNNAGISMRGKFITSDIQAVHEVFSINVLSTIDITQIALPYLRNTSGDIIFISSLAGIRGLENNSIYGASKMSLRAIAESIRIEESPYGIHTGLILVGPTENDDTKKILNSNGSWRHMPRPTCTLQSTKSVAESTLKNIVGRKFITTLTIPGKLNYYINKIAPSIMEKLLIRLSKKFELDWK